MSQVAFYQLRTTALEKALPKLLEKAISGGMRAFVVAGSAEQVETLNAALWTYDPASFLPHGTVREGAADRQPILIATDADTGTHGENPNDASLLVLLNGAQVSAPAAFSRCVDMFDGRIDSELVAARARWKHHTDTGDEVTYYEQTADGRWEKRA